MSKKKKNKKKEYGVDIDKLIFRRVNGDDVSEIDTLDDAISEYVRKNSQTPIENKIPYSKPVIYESIKKPDNNVCSVADAVSFAVSNALKAEVEEEPIKTLYVDKEETMNETIKSSDDIILEDLDIKVEQVQVSPFNKLQITNRYGDSYSINIDGITEELIERFSNNIDDDDLSEVTIACLVQTIASNMPIATYTMQEFTDKFSNVKNINTDRFILIRDDELNIAHGFYISDNIYNIFNELVNAFGDRKRAIATLTMLAIESSNHIWIDKEMSSTSVVKEWLDSDYNYKDAFANALLNEDKTELVSEPIEDNYYELTDDYSFILEMTTSIIDRLSETKEKETGVQNDAEPFREDDFKYECETQEIKKEEEEVFESRDTNEEDETSELEIEETDPEEFTFETPETIKKDDSMVIPVIRG